MKSNPGTPGKLGKRPKRHSKLTIETLEQMKNTLTPRTGEEHTHPKIKVKKKNTLETYSEPSQKSTMKLFCEKS